MKDIGSRQAVNKTAAVVTGKGYAYAPDKRVACGESDLPIPLGRFTGPLADDMTGRRCGRLVVLGPSREPSHPKTGLSWVARCVCGRYVLRKAKAIKNPKNADDKCDLCRHVRFLQKQDYFQRTGKRLD